VARTTQFITNFEIQAGGQVKDSYYGFINAWDNAYTFGGNYWSY
jgi:hypothetical protein